MFKIVKTTVASEVAWTVEDQDGEFHGEFDTPQDAAEWARRRFSTRPFDPSPRRREEPQDFAQEDPCDF